MRTTVTLDERLLLELMRYSIAKTKTEAVALAVKEQIRRAKLKTLADRLGSIEVDEKAIEEGNNADIKRAQWLNGIGVDGDSKL
ncbi:MAG TPA: type II toxin-antitoxin system VapB family antitoxin [Candidatus Kapabacteria bacterium]|nr:type II toxin-antitoxin system VapB family antitoxin [Candidatus Kapabacteria bacterium]